MTEASTARPSAVLETEHQVILDVLGVLEGLLAQPEGGRLDPDPLECCVEFFRLYADRCHHAKEEDLLFPVLESRGIANEDGPIGVMLEEHRLARSLIALMDGALPGVREGDATAESDFRQAARDYLELLRQHIFKEDHVLFEVGDGVMTDDDQARLASRFCEADCQDFGGRRREELEAMADELVRNWGAV